MLKQVRLLTKVQICNLFGLNEVMHTKDKKAKHRYLGMTILQVFLILVFISYVVGLAVGLVWLGIADVIPMYLFAITSMLILFFSFFKASSVIFQVKTFELMITLPVSGMAIVISRFLTMYLTNLLLSILFVAPGIVVYGINSVLPASSYIYALAGIILLPLLPMTLGAAVGAAITAVSSRMRHKSMTASILTVLVACIVLVASMVLSGNAEKLNKEILENISGIITTQISKTYYPAVWFGNAVARQSLKNLMILVLLSLGVFAVLIFVLQKYFVKICTALKATSAKKNYKMQKLRASSNVKTLWKRELKRYFASSIYVSNTMIGYIIMAILAGALLVVGPEKLESVWQLPGVIDRALPVILGMTAAIMPVTSCSISMEGKNWWIVRSLPIENKVLFDSKILTNLTVALPWYILAEILAWLAVKPGFMEGLWLLVIPAVYIIYSSVVGITMNLKFPVMEWDSEVRVVKQSASTMLSMLAGFVTAVPPLAILIAVRTMNPDIVFGVLVAVLAILTIILYQANNRKVLA